MKNIYKIFVFSIVTIFSAMLIFPAYTLSMPGESSFKGKVVTLIEDNIVNKTSVEKNYLQTDDLKLYEIKSDVKVPKAGSEVTLIGNQSDSRTLKANRFVTNNAPIDNSNAIIGNNRVAVILANFNNLSTSTPSNSSAKRNFDRNLSPFMAQMSYNKATFVADVYGWVTMNVGSSCTTSDYAQSAINSADHLINFNNYKYVMLVIPDVNCGFAGKAYYPPGVSYTTNEGTKTLQVSVLVNKYYNDWLKTVGSHELGHSLGLKHANGLDCGINYLGGTCSEVEYGDQYDVMGGTYNYVGHYGAYNKEFLNWISSNNVRVVNTSGRYTVTSLETSTSNVQSLKVVIPGNTSNYYSVENRTTKSLPTSATNGALIKLIPISLTGVAAPGSSIIIDSTPNSQSSDFNDAGWTLGKTFDDTVSRIRITPISESQGNLTVDVLYY